MSEVELRQKLIDKFGLEYMEKVGRICSRLGLSCLVGYHIVNLLCKKGIISDETEVARSFVINESLIFYCIYFVSDFIKNNQGSLVDKPYFEVVHNFRKLSKEFDLKDPVELYTLYSIMYDNGYLSANKEFNFDNGTTLRKNLGSTVLTGEGLCRHIAGFFSDILNSKEDYNITAATVGVYAYDNDEEKENKARGISSSLLLLPIYRLFGNHAITVCEYNDQMYAFDPTNLSNLKLYDEKKRILRGSSLDHKLLHNELLCLRINYKRPYSEINKAMKTKEFYKYTEEDIIRVKKLTEDIENNLDMLNKFYNDNKDLYEEVTSRFKGSIRKRK